MKKLSVLLFLFAVASPVLAQHRPGAVRQVAPDRYEVGAAGKVTAFNDTWGLMSGLQVDWLAVRAFSVGAEGYIQTTELYDRKMVSGAPGRLEGGYGGFTLGYRWNPAERLHLSANNLVGMGRMRLVEGRRSDTVDEAADKSTFFVLEPGAKLAYNIARSVNVGLGVSYRFAMDSELQGLSRADLSGPAGMLSLNFRR